MKAMVLRKIVSLDREVEPLVLEDRPMPVAGPGEVLLHVWACGVCHTELDEIEGRTAPPSLPVVPGHEIVGTVVAAGAGVSKPAVGERVGVGWIHSGSGARDENVSATFRATGRDADGGYAEYATAVAQYTYKIPERFPSEKAAPLLCAGAIGYRALKLSRIADGDRLGLTGFGGSAHLVLQAARHLFPRSDVYVFARDAEARAFAIENGAVWSGETGERAPQLLHAIIDTTPAWEPVVEALANLRPGGRLVINAIRKEDGDKHALQSLSYESHLWMEKEIKSVANITRFDIAEFLEVADRAEIDPEVTTYPLADANRALLDLKHRPVRGAKVLVME
jgi:propanol-preferring alcohol dehydrogenase